MRRTTKWAVGVVAAVVALLCCGVAQAAGPPTGLALQLSPPSIVADGTSTSVLTATVTDAQGNGVPGQQVYVNDLNSNPPPPPTLAVDHGNGTYTATLTSSLKVGPVSVTAVVSGTSLSQTKVLTQVAASTTSLNVVTNGPVSPTNLPVTNQSALLIATVTVSNAGVSPAGTVTFTNGGAPISGCGPIPTSGTGASLTVTCATAFTAAQSPTALAASFTPSPGTYVLASASPADAVAVDRDPTSAAVIVPGTTAHVDTPVTYTALVTPSQTGAARPSGSIVFLDNGVAIPGCSAQPVSGFGTAQCTRTYATPGTHTITATYGGDVNFAPAGSSPASLSIQPLGTINATMLWTFQMTGKGTRIVALDVLNVDFGSSVAVRCHGARCPLRSRTVDVRKSCRGVKHKRSCSVSHRVHLAGWFGRHVLRPGTVVTVQITRSGWVGKVYQFSIRRGQMPRPQILCLPPGTSTPVAGC